MGRRLIFEKRAHASPWNPETPFDVAKLLILTGSSNPRLARDVAELLHVQVDEPTSCFADGEVRVDISHSMRHKEVYIIQPTAPPDINRSLIELVLMMDAAKRASADTINVVIPYFGYARQDRKDRPRTSISTKVIADILVHSGADRIITVDLHSEQSQGHVNIPWDNLWGDIVLVPRLKMYLKGSTLAIASPDAGGQKRAEKYMRLMEASSLSFVYKKRDAYTPNQVSAKMLAGEVEGKDVLLVDDMIDTAGTLTGAAHLLKKSGARKIFAVATHGLFSEIPDVSADDEIQSGLDRIHESIIDAVFVTDTIVPREEVVMSKKVVVISIAPLLAEAIRRTHTGESFNKGIIL